MAKQTIKVNNLGQYGYLPDVQSTLLPLNAFSYSRNWRFSEAGHAEVTNGYGNALDTQTTKTVGNDLSELTFMYTWLLSGDNAAIYYDSTDRRLGLAERTTSVVTQDYIVSQTDSYSADLTYKDTDESALAVEEFTFNNDTELALRFQDSESAIDFTAAADSSEVTFQLYGVDTDGRFNKQFSLLTTAATRDTDIVTVNIGDAFTSSNLQTDSIFQVAAGTLHQHPETAAYIWSATDAFGVPIFTNPREEPWYFKDDTVPSIERLENWPTDALCETMVKFNAFLFAIGYENSNGPAGEQGGPRTIAISDVITVPGTLPTWDFNNSGSFAQIFDLSLYTDGPLVGAIEANNILYVFSTTDTIAMSYDGEGAFSATRLPIGGGTLATKMVCAIPNGRFHIGNGRMYIEDGNTYQEVGEGRWSDTWFSIYDDTRINEIQCVYDTRSHSVWIKTPTSDTAQEIWIYNLDNQSMSVLDDHQEIKYMLWSADGLPNENFQWNSFEDGDTWDNLTENSWNDFPTQATGIFRNRLLSCGGNKFFVHDYGFDFNGRDINAILQREGVPAQDSSYYSYCIERVIPWIDATEGDMTDIRVGGTNSYDRAVSWTPYKPWVTGTTNKLDFRKNAKWGAIGFRSATPNTKLTGYEIDVAPQNRR